MKRMAMTAMLLCSAGSVATAGTALAGFGLAALDAAAALDAQQAVAIGFHEADDRGTNPGADYPVCLTGLSKDDCDGLVYPGRYSTTVCQTSACRTVTVTDAVYVARMRSSGEGCGLICETRCDEFPDGELRLRFDYHVRMDSCCPYRGKWSGEWTYVTTAGRTYSGKAHGTIGAGTNRRSGCDLVHDTCERCSDVEYQNGSILMGFEGAFQGWAVFSTLPTPEELDFTMDGTWIIDPNTARPFTTEFKVKNRFEGTHLQWRCP
jgi:hypothetical protein